MISGINKFVDLPRIELGTVQCECTGIPLTYKPEIVTGKLLLFFWKLINKLTKYLLGCGLDRIRTGDLFYAIEALYQLSYEPGIDFWLFAFSFVKYK